MDTPEDLVDQVCDEGSFLVFLEALAKDFRREREIESANPSPAFSRGALGWENRNIDDVLDAAAAYASATCDRWTNDGPVSIWKRCAQILMAGKFYE